MKAFDYGPNLLWSNVMPFAIIDSGTSLLYVTSETFKKIGKDMNETGILFSEEVGIYYSHSMECEALAP